MSPQASLTVTDLGRAVKAKYAGQYDDLPDDELGRKVRAKYPGAYDDYADAPAQPTAVLPGVQNAARQANATVEAPAQPVPLMPQPIPGARVPQLGIPSPQDAIAHATATGQALAAMTAPQPQTISATPAPGFFGRMGQAFTGPGTLYGNLEAQRTGAQVPYNPDAPLVDFSANQKQITDGPIAKGFTQGAQEFLSGLTTPQSIGLMLATGGLGPAGKLSQLSEPAIGKLAAAGAKYMPMVRTLVSGGFSLDMIRSALMQSPELIRQIKKGDTEGATRTLTGMAATLGMGTAAGIHAAGGAREITAERKAAKTAPAEPEQQYTLTGQPIGGPAAQPAQTPAAPAQPPAATVTAAPAVVDPLKRQRGEKYSAWQERIKAAAKPPAAPEVLGRESPAQKAVREGQKVDEAASEGRKAVVLDVRKMDDETRGEYRRFRRLLQEQGNLDLDTGKQAVEAILAHKDWAERFDVSDPELIALGNKFGGWPSAAKLATTPALPPGFEVETKAPEKETKEPQRETKTTSQTEPAATVHAGKPEPHEQPERGGGKPAPAETPAATVRTAVPARAGGTEVTGERETPTKPMNGAEHARRVKELRKGGMSYEDAVAQANAENEKALGLPPAWKKTTSAAPAQPKAANDRVAKIDAQLQKLDDSYMKRMNEKGGFKPPAIKADALASLAKMMDKLLAERAKLVPPGTPDWQPQREIERLAREAERPEVPDGINPRTGKPWSKTPAPEAAQTSAAPAQEPPKTINLTPLLTATDEEFPEKAMALGVQVAGPDNNGRFLTRSPKGDVREFSSRVKWNDNQRNISDAPYAWTPENIQRYGGLHTPPGTPVTLSPAGEESERVRKEATAERHARQEKEAAEDELKELQAKYQGPGPHVALAPKPGTNAFNRDMERMAELREQLGKQIWQRPQAAAQRIEGIPPARHREAVERAIAEGKTVPPEVLADYPDLAKPQETKRQARIRTLISNAKYAQAEAAKETRAKQRARWLEEAADDLDEADRLNKLEQADAALAAAKAKTAGRTLPQRNPEDILDDTAALRKIQDVYLPRSKREAGANATRMAEKIREALALGRPEANVKGQRVALDDFLREHFPELYGETPKTPEAAAAPTPAETPAPKVRTAAESLKIIAKRIKELRAGGMDYPEAKAQAQAEIDADAEARERERNPPAPEAAQTSAAPAQPKAATTDVAPGILDRLSAAGKESERWLRENGITGGSLSANRILDPEVLFHLTRAVAGDVARGVVTLRTAAQGIADRLRDKFDGVPPIGAIEDRIRGHITESAGKREVGPHGPVLRNFYHDAQGAIMHLLGEGAGDAVGALHHPEVGDIDLIWGKPGAKGYGLAKIAERHREVLPDLQGVLNRLREKSRNENTIQLDGDGYSAIIRRNWKGDAKTWLLTAFGKAEEGTGPSAERTIDVPGTHATERQAPPPGGSDSSVTPAQSAVSSAAQRGEPGWVGNVPTSELHVDAPRFQFKQNVGQGGAGEEFREVTHWDPEKAGIVSVWRDPADGKDYVVNGHHRFEMASRLGAPEMTVRYLDAKDAAKARLKGAFINIGEGRGDVTDAAKVLRESGLSIEDLKAQGLSLKGKLASEGLGVSKLAQPIYEDVMRGDLSTARGAIIGHGIERPADQIALYDALKKREAGGKRLTNSQLEEMIRLAKGAPTKIESNAGQSQFNMFGEQEMERGLLPEKAEISEYVRKQLGSERKLFSLVGDQGAAAKLGAAGNVIRAEQNARIAEQAAQVQELYDRLSSVAGDIDDALNQAAKRLAEGENPNEVKQDAYNRIRTALIEQSAKYSGVPAVGLERTGGHAAEGASEVEPVRAGPEPPGQPPPAPGPSRLSEGRSVAPEAPAAGEEGRLIPESSSTPEGERLAREERAKLQAEQASQEIRFGRGRSLDAGRESIEDSPLFGGPRQGGMFDDPEGGSTLEFMGLHTLATGLGRAAKAFGEKDVVPTLKDAAAGVRDFVRDAMTILTPTLRSKTGERASLIFRARLAELARGSDQARYALRDASRYFDRQKAADNYDFIARMEAGQPQDTPELDTIAATLRKLLDERRLAVQALGKGKLRKFYTNYFPHIWKDARKAETLFAAFFGKRPLEGGKSFLKQRTLPTFADGIDRGLEPLSDNPVDLVLAKLHEMDRFVMAHRVLDDWKRTGLAKFVDARKGKAPRGWKKIDEGIGTVYGPSIQNISEYPNEGLWEGLKAVGQALGIEHRRGFLKLHDALGRAYQGKARIDTLHATDMSTVAHEIGHQIDWLAGSGKRFILEYPDPATVQRLKAAYKTLKDPNSAAPDRKAARAELKAAKDVIADRKEFQKQLRDLADLRTGGTQEYRRSREEKMAQLAQMWAGARPLFEKTAPKVFALWKKFLNENPKLHALRDIEASANSTMLAQPYDVGGLVIKGHYYAPEGAALIMNNYLSPGLRRFAAYRGIAALNNALNQAQLGLSAFHLGFVSADTAVSKTALGYQALLRGRPIKAAKYFAQTPLAPLTTYLEGRRGIREWRAPGSQGAALAGMVDNLERAGGRISNDPVYQTDIRRNMMAAYRQGNILGAAVRAPFAATEALSGILMSHIVPAMKVGAALDLMRFHMEEMDPNASAEDVSRTLAQDWNSVENRLGQMTYDNLFWNRVGKDLAMIGVRSVGWNLGTLREIGAGIGDIAAQPYNRLKGKPVNLNRLSYLAGLVTTTAVMSAIYQYLHTGKGPQELEDYFFPKNGGTDEQGRPQRSSPPTYIKDVYHYATHPGKTIANKLAPIWSVAEEMWNNKDFYGNQVRNADDPLVKQLGQLAEHAAKSTVPIGVRNYQRETNLGSSPATRFEQFVGMSPAPAELNKTAAERLAADLSAERTGDEAGRPAEAAERRELRLGLTRALRAGKAIPKETLDAIKAGKLKTSDLKAAYQRAHESPLEAAFLRATIADALKIYRAATADERRRLKAMLLKKGTAALKTEAPAERLKTAQALREAFAVR